MGFDKGSLEGVAKRGLVRFAGRFLKSRTFTGKPIDPSQVGSILLIRVHDWLGDAVMGTPAIQTIREGFPGASMDFLTRPDIAPLFRGDDRFRRLWQYDKREMRRGPWGMIGLVRRLRAERYDAAVVLSSFSYSVTGAALAALSGARIRVGFDGTPFGYPHISQELLTHVVPAPQGEMHEVHRGLLLAKAMGAGSVQEHHRLQIQPGDLERAKKDLASRGVNGPGPVVGLHLGSKKIHQLWPVERFAAVGDRVAKEWGASVVLTIGPGEQPLAEAYLAKAGMPAVILQVPLGDLPAHLACLDVLVCTDTAPLHIAAGVDTRTAGIFMEGDPARWGPRGHRHLAVMRTLHKPESVSVEMVYHAVEEVLRRP